jgi:glutamate-5-semialdehyde dehydrogenase
VATVEQSVLDRCRAAKAAAVELAASPADDRNRALNAIARLLEERTEDILAANAADLNDPRAANLTSALVDRLSLDAGRVAAMAAGVREIVKLDDPVGEVLERRDLASGLELTKIRVPLGVIAVVYEARPNVTIDCAGLTIKSGNAIVLRGSSYAERSNGALAAIVREGLAEAGLPEDAAVLLSSEDRESLRELAAAEGLIDLLIPRGGEGLKAAIQEVAKVPVMYAASGNCHVYVHSDADLEKARAIAFNAKVQRPGVCNAAETLLVDATVAPAFLPPMLAQLHEAGVELLGDERVIENAGDTPVSPASPEDWDTEFLDLKLAVAVVDSLDDAIAHVQRHGSGHSEAIVTESELAAAAFASRVDAAAIYINASTRFTDGFEYGMGAEIGNSTQKLHARGPIGVRELTTFKYVARGDGQIRG